MKQEEQPNPCESRCRLCFSVEDLTCALFPAQDEPSREVIEMILECTSIRITLEEDYPSKVCAKCVETLDKFYQYRRRCLLNDQSLRAERRQNKAAANHLSDGGGDSALVVHIKREPPAFDEDVEPAAPEVADNPAEGPSSILRSILLQTTSRSSPETNHRQTPPKPTPAATPSSQHEDDLKPSLLQQMLQQQQSPAQLKSQSPPVAGPSNQPGAAAAPLVKTEGTTSSSSLLKRMLLDGGVSAAEQRQSPHEGPSHQGGAANAPELPPDDQLRNEHSETPLASQLRTILLQHRAAAVAAAALARSEHAESLALLDEKPEVSYMRSLFLRHDSESESEAPSEDQRELFYSMFQELRAHQQAVSSDSDDSPDDAPFDYRMPSVRRRSTESAEPRKRRKLDYPCLLCGRTFSGRTKLVLHMRTHMVAPPLSSTPTPPASCAVPLPPPPSGLAPPPPPPALLPLLNGSPVGANSGDHHHHHHHHHQHAGGTAVNDDEEIDILERRSYACYICSADQNNLQQLREHLLTAHQDRIRSRGRARDRQKPIISCEFCTRQFRSQFAYSEHLRTHTGERPFPCDQCDKRFPRRFQLLGHLYNVHKQSWVADESKAKFAKK